MMEDRAYGWFHAMALGAASNKVEPVCEQQHWRARARERERESVLLARARVRLQPLRSRVAGCVRALRHHSWF